ncbi:MAG: shikimate kinase [Alphaproteobacteria bacterium]|jgi:shikimate kinase|nr:shikimate kinase [Alphaproteobacteria bacterium]
MTAPSDLKLPKPLVFIGMMGAGKTAIGRRVAARLDIPFIDADSEIEAAAGCSISDIFELHGETAFRNGERRVIGRLLEGPIQVLATGGGAFIDRETREVIKKRGISVWLRADLETLWRRVSRRDHRPLLKTENPRETLSALVEQRYPVYAGADITVDSSDGPRDEMVERVIEAVAGYLPASEET